MKKKVNCHLYIYLNIFWTLKSARVNSSGQQFEINWVRITETFTLNHLESKNAAILGSQLKCRFLYCFQLFGPKYAIQNLNRNLADESPIITAIRFFLSHSFHAFLAFVSSRTMRIAASVFMTLVLIIFFCRGFFFNMFEYQSSYCAVTYNETLRWFIVMNVTSNLRIFASVVCISSRLFSRLSLNLAHVYLQFKQFFSLFFWRKICLNHLIPEEIIIAELLWEYELTNKAKNRLVKVDRCWLIIT